MVAYGFYVLLFLALGSYAFCEKKPVAERAFNIKKTGNDWAELQDISLFFTDSLIHEAKLSPDGKWVAFIQAWEGVPNIWMTCVEGKEVKPRLLTTEKTHQIGQLHWSTDGKWIIYVKDKPSLRSADVCIVNPRATPEKGEDVPPTWELTDTSFAQAKILHVGRQNPDCVYIALNERDAANHDVYQLCLTSAVRTLMLTNTQRFSAYWFDRQDRLRVAAKENEQGGLSLFALRDRRMYPLFQCDRLEECFPLAMHAGGEQVYVKHNHGVDLHRLSLLDFNGGKARCIAQDPKEQRDLASAFFSEATGQLLATTYQGDPPRLQTHDTRFKRDWDRIRRQLPSHHLHRLSASQDEKTWLLWVKSNATPGDLYAYQRMTGKLALVRAGGPGLDARLLGEQRFVTYPSRDGLSIHARLTIPRGVPSMRLPLVVLPHGGPWLSNGWGFDGEAQFLANRGYAVLQPEFRGSSGRGKAFLNKGNRQWGLAMQDDLTWGVNHLVSRGIVDPQRVAIMGRSYGGYAALAGAAFTPTLYKAAISLSGPSHLLGLMESLPRTWGFERTNLVERIGDPDTASGRLALEAQSPVNHAGKVTIPVLFAQGGLDPRAKWQDTEKMVLSLRDRHVPVTYLSLPKEGHLFRDPVNNQAVYLGVERFLAQHLGGRQQAEPPPMLKARLASLQVDVHTLVHETGTKEEKAPPSPKQ